MDVVSGIATFGVLALSVWELKGTLAAPSPRRTRLRASLDWRCPFCHQPIDDGSERVRCSGCGTQHHATCWTEHQGCSVFACGSLQPRRRREPPPGAPAGVPTAAAADPVG